MWCQNTAIFGSFVEKKRRHINLFIEGVILGVYIIATLRPFIKRKRYYIDSPIIGVIC